MAKFDEAAYLEANPDVAAAVKSGAFSSGAEHYEWYGKSENRTLDASKRPAPRAMPFSEDFKPNRRDKILASLDLTQTIGVEIGALASPLVLPAEGNILFVDHADTEYLKQKYGADSTVNVSKIVHIDGVWGEKTLKECLNLTENVNYVLASHVIEHVPDLITWLAEIHSILKPSGTLRVAVPDRRYTFDYLRHESRVHDVLDAYLRRARSPSPRQIIEHFSMARMVNCKNAWDGTLNVNALQPHHTTQMAIDTARDAIDNGTYQDSHCWVFTPKSFANLFVDMAKLDLLKFAYTHHFETVRYELEFVVHMSPSDNKDEIVKSWTDMAAAATG